MGSIPWEDWFYHLEYKRKEINQLHENAVDLVNLTQSNLILLNSHLEQYRAMVAMNGTLLVTKAQTVMSDLELKDYTAKVGALPTMPGGVLPLQVMEVLAESVATTLVLRLLWNSAKAIYRRFFATAAKQAGEASLRSSSEELLVPLVEAGMREESIIVLGGASENVAKASIEQVKNVGEDVTEQAAKTILGDLTASSLAATGVGIFAAVGIDAIFGAINGAVERDKLDDLIAKLQTAVNKAQSFSDQVTKKINTVKENVVTQEKLFINLVYELDKLKPATFTYQYPTNWNNQLNFVIAQQQAVQEYSVLIDLRQYYLRAIARHQDATKQTIIEHYMDSAPESVTQADVEQYWDILAKYSDGMKKIA
ncbi:MAG: hypothetical protein AAF614_04735 [Chloroflexota bacterium]